MVFKVLSDSRVLSDPFMKLPSRKELPDYYEVIKKPMDIRKIVSRIEESRYCDFDELERDFMQLCKNAQMYNEEASLIHEDSIVLQSVFTNARQRLSQEPESDDEEDSKGGTDEGALSDGESSVKVKLKLKSGKGRNSSNRRKRSKKYISDDEEDEIESLPL